MSADGPVVGSLCSGYGGLDLAVLDVLGGRVAWHAEIDPAALAVLAARWPGVPNLGDLTAVDWSAVEPVDVLAAGYPCQPFSEAGHRKGEDDPRHLWPHVKRAVRDLRPPLVVLENVRGHLSRGFGAVLGDLAALGYDARWTCLRASDVGAPHHRARVFVLAAPDPGRMGRGAGPGLRPHAPSRLGWRRPRDDGRPDAAHPERLGRAGRPACGAGPQDEPGGGPRAATAGRGADAAADTLGDRRHQGRAEHARILGRPHVAVGRDAAAAHADGEGRQGSGLVVAARAAGSARGDAPADRWGVYAAAVDRWERIIGRPAPHPTVTGRTGGPVLNPQLPEWMLGLPDGWVTAVPGIARTAALRILGNGVAPAQGAAALRILLDPTTGDPMDDEPVPAGQARIFTPLDPPVPRMPLPPVGKGAPPAQWSTVARGGRHRCDECVRAQMLDPAAPVARAARHKRAQGAVDMLLCDGHARPIRDRDQREAKRAAR